MSIMRRLLCYLQVSALSGKAATEGDYLKSLGATEVNIFYSKLTCFVYLDNFTTINLTEGSVKITKYPRD